MRILNGIIEGGYLKFDETNAGNAFDNLATALKISVPVELRGAGYSYHLIFQTPAQKISGTGYESEPLELAQIDNSVSFALPQAIMREGKLNIQFSAIDEENLTHSAIATLDVGPSIPGAEPIEDEYVGLLEDLIKLTGAHWNGCPDSIPVPVTYAGAVKERNITFSTTLINGVTRIDQKTGATVSVELPEGAPFTASASISSDGIDVDIVMNETVTGSSDTLSILLTTTETVYKHIITIFYPRDGDAGAPGAQGARGYSGLVPAVTVPFASAFTAAANTKTTVTVTGDMWVLLGEGVSGYDNEWDVVLIMGDTAHTVTLPTVVWGYGASPTFSANTTTEVRLYYIGSTLCGEWQVV